MRSPHVEKRLGIRSDWSQRFEVPLRLAVTTLAFSGRYLKSVRRVFHAAGTPPAADDGSTQNGRQTFNRAGGSEGTDDS